MKNYKLYNLITAILIFLVFRPTIIMEFEILDKIISFTINVISVITLLYWIVNKGVFDSLLLSTFVFFGIMIMLTIFDSWQFTNIFSTIKIFLSVLLLQYLYKFNPNKFFDITKGVLLFLVTINLLSMIIFPNGIIQIHQIANEYYQYYQPWWIFGHKNNIFFWIMGLLMLSQIGIFNNINKKNYVNIFSIIIVFVSALVSKSSTTIICIILSCLLFIYSLVFKIRLNLKNKKLVSALCIFAYFAFSFVLFNFNDIFIFKFISSMFGKDVTFTGRTDAWSSAITLFINRPLFGYGILSENQMRFMLGNYAFVNAHNTLLQLLINGGIILLLPYISILFLLLLSILKISTTFKKQKYILFTSMIILMLASNFESYISNLMFWNTIAIIFYYTKYFQDNKNISRFVYNKNTCMK